MKKKLYRLAPVCLLLSLSGCGSNDPTVVGGNVVQGNVQGANVCADRNNNGICDAGEVSTANNTDASTRVTDANGHFVLAIPDGYGPYRFVTYGGTDTTTNLPAAQLIAEAGSSNITPLTTLVATVPADQKAALVSTLASLGLTKVDADITTSTPAVIALAKSVETALTAMKNTATTGSVNNYGLSVALQSQAAVEIAKAVASASTATLTNPAALASTISTSVGSALTAVQSDATYGSQITVTNAAAITSSISTSIQTVAQAISTAAGGLGVSSTVSEATIVTPLASTIQTSIQTITTAALNNVTVIAAPTPITPPNTGTSGGTSGGTGNNF